MKVEEEPRKSNRIASIFERFATNYEFPHRMDPDKLGAEIGIPEGGKEIHAKYQFDPSEDGYEYAANLGRVCDPDRVSVALKVMESRPIRGVTERILGDSFIITGSRDALSGLSDAEIKRSLMDDVSRVSLYRRTRKEYFTE